MYVFAQSEATKLATSELHRVLNSLASELFTLSPCLANAEKVDSLVTEFGA